jgi:hypothetical protein
MRTLDKLGVPNSKDLLENATEHGECKVLCGKQLPCGHECKKTCHSGVDCGICNQPCNTLKCEHGKCSHPCHESCIACAEDCTWVCEHEGRCPVKCGFPCTRAPCDKRCEKVLSCGHQCPSICGEPCPSPKYCQICGSDDVLNMEADVIMFEQYRDIHLDETPVLILDCGHVKTVESMDGIVEFSKYFVLENGKWTLAGPILGVGDIVPMPVCPDCRRPVTCKRYGRIIKRSAIDTAEKLFILKCDQRLAQLKKEFQNLSTVPPQEIPLINQRFKSFEKAAKSFAEFGYYSPTRKIYDSYIKGLKQTSGQKENVPKPMTRFCFEGDLLRGQGFYLKAKAIEKRIESTKLTGGEEILNAIKFMFVSMNQAMKFSKSCIDIGRNNKLFLKTILLKQLEYKRDFVNMIRKYNQRMGEGIPGVVYLKKDEKNSTLTERWKEYYLDLGKGTMELIPEIENLYPNKDEIPNVVKEIQTWLTKLPQNTTFGMITVEEEREIFQVVQTTIRGSGHWYRCPNGHLYVIGECGMAMQTSRCNECGESIGGDSHTLLSTNTHSRDFEERMQRQPTL